MSLPVPSHPLPRSLSRSFRFAAVFAALALALPGHSQSKKIVFLSGPKDHGIPGRHEYEKDLRVLARCLETSSNVPGITTAVYVGKAPRDLNELKDAAVIVIESSSDRSAKEVHPLFPPEPTTDRHGYDAETAAYLKEFDGLIKGGVGIVILHYANWVENWAARGFYMDWVGGLWVQMVSKNPNDDWQMTPTATGHPVLNGVREWNYHDEVFCRFFLPEDPRRTDLLIGKPSKTKLPPQVVSWAYQRDGGGRGFVMGGVDFHVNMQVEDYRRFLLNGIVWAGRMEVPAGGVQSSVPNE